jgi:hypothetical protein
LLASFTLSARLITWRGTFTNGTIHNGQIGGKCVTSPNNCWTYNTDTKDLTIHGFGSFRNATLPVMDGEIFSATYED